MTKQRTLHYVRAIQGAGVHAEWQSLLGPFSEHMAAFKMERVVERACARHGLYKGHTFGIWRTRLHSKPGALDLAAIVDQDWINDTIQASRRHD